eukprot:6194837-Pleurochrysis_carterae.AAC.2
MQLGHACTERRDLAISAHRAVTRRHGDTMSTLNQPLPAAKAATIKRPLGVVHAFSLCAAGVRPSDGSLDRRKRGSSSRSSEIRNMSIRSQSAGHLARR